MVAYVSLVKALGKQKKKMRRKGEKKNSMSVINRENYV